MQKNTLVGRFGHISKEKVKEGEKMMRTKWYGLFSVVAVLAFLLAACGGGPAAAPAASGETAPSAREWKSKDPSSWVETTFGEAYTLDVTQCYESAGGEIIENVYDRLLWYKKDSAQEFIPWLATEVPSLENGGISADGLTYTFKIRQGVKFHNGSDLTLDNVAFSWHRNILAGGTNSPQWMWVEALFGAGLADISEVLAALKAGIDINDPAAILAYVQGEGSGLVPYDDPEAVKANDPALLVQVCEAVKSKVVTDPAAGAVVFKLAQPWAPFLATFLGYWGSIQNKAWVGANGGWDGDCATWQDYYAPVVEDLNMLGVGNSAMGTGPYKFDHWTTGEEITLTANENFWLTEPMWEGMPVGAPALKTVVIRQVSEFNTRLAMALAGDADNIEVGSTSDWPIVDEYVGEKTTYADWMAGKPVTAVDSTKPLRLLNMIDNFNNRTDVGFMFRVNTEGGNTYIGSGKLDGDGIPADFFSDAAVRRAFSYCFNYDVYLNDVLMGEGVRAPTLMLPGMSGYDENAPHFEYDIEKCREELKKSYWKSEDGRQLFDVGFRMSAVFNVGNTQRQTIAELLQAGLQEAGPQFVVETIGLPWPAFNSAIRASKVPVFIIGWISDYYDTHNWINAFMVAYYAFKQRFPTESRIEFANIALEGVQITDPAERDAYYKNVFNPKFHDFASTIVLFHVLNHDYLPRYVKGYYNNPIYSNKWYYVLSKD